jgi:TIR domain
MSKFDVFISYSSKDKAATDATCAALERARIRCWVAPRDIAPGAEWGASIVGAIDACRVFVLIFSSNANTSKQVTREVQRAFRNEVPVVPLRIEETKPTDTLAYFIDTVHWLDAITPPFEKHLEKLTATVAALLRTAISEREVARSSEREIEAILPMAPDQARTTVESSPARPDGDTPDAQGGGSLVPPADRVFTEQAAPAREVKAEILPVRKRSGAIALIAGSGLLAAGVLGYYLYIPSTPAPATNTSLTPPPSLAFDVPAGCNVFFSRVYPDFKKVALIRNQFRSARIAAEIVEGRIGQAGYSLRNNVTYPPGRTDFVPFIQRFKDDRVGTIIHCGDAGNAEQLARELGQQNF